MQQVIPVTESGDEQTGGAGVVCVERTLLSAAADSCPEKTKYSRSNRTGPQCVRTSAVRQTDRHLWSPGFPCDPLCPLWLKPLTSSPDTTDHADRGAIFNDHYFRRTTLVFAQSGGTKHRRIEPQGVSAKNLAPEGRLPRIQPRNGVCQESSPGGAT